MILGLASTLALKGKTDEAIELIERGLPLSINEKQKSTMRATLCFLYLKAGQKEKANRLASELPHSRECPELYRSVGISEIEKQGWSLVPSKYIEFIDHDLEIDFDAEMNRIQKEMHDLLAQEKQSQKMLEDAFRGIGHEL